MPANNAQIYRVQAGDTLSGIAVRTRKTVIELMNLNGIKNPNKIDVGQILFLNKETAFSAQALFLDALRQPIENLVYKFVIDGKASIGKTQKDGLSPEVVTRSAKSKIEVHVKDPYGNWQQLTSTISDYGKKIITLVSPDILFKDTLQPHPVDAPTTPQPPAQPAEPPAQGRQPPLPRPASGEPIKNNPDVKKKHTKGKNGENVIQLEVAIPPKFIELFQQYQPEKITEAMWAEHAADLKCEAAVIKAIAQVETGKGGAFWRLNSSNGAYIPSILYERHVFRKITKGRFDNDYPDVSGPARKSYGSNRAQYLRLINAYRLDADAALRATSWGAFQILGDSYNLCKLSSVLELVATAAESEAGQIKLLTAFIKNKAGGKLLVAVREKNWRGIATYYNGLVQNPKTGLMEVRDEYDKRLRNAYEKIKITG